jgi:hypothetical protein
MSGVKYIRIFSLSALIVGLSLVGSAGAEEPVKPTLPKSPCYQLTTRKGDIVDMGGFWTLKKDGAMKVSGKVNDVATDIASDKIRSIVFASIVSTCAQGHIRMLDNTHASFFTCNTIQFESKFGESHISPTQVASIAQCK